MKSQEKVTCGNNLKNVFLFLHQNMPYGYSLQLQHSPTYYFNDSNPKTYFGVKK